MHRPLSPHLQIYKPQLTSILSISHRISGVFLCLGLMLMIGWLSGIVVSEANYCTIMQWYKLGAVKLIIWGSIFAAYFHYFNGLRYLGWSLGLGFKIKQIYISGYLALFLASLAAAGSIYFAGW